jgi:hypothetical protein
MIFVQTMQISFQDTAVLTLGHLAARSHADLVVLQLIRRGPTFLVGTMAFTNPFRKFADALDEIPDSLR